MENHKTLLLYGAGERGAMLYHLAKRNYGDPAGYIDQDCHKQGHRLFGLPILSWEEARKTYGEDFSVFVCGTEQVAPEMVGFLLEQGVAPERIVNFEPVEKRPGCADAESILRVVSSGEEILTSTCDRYTRTLQYCELPKQHTGYESASDAGVLQDIVRSGRNRARNIRDGQDEGCSDCSCFRRQYHFQNQKIRTVSFGGKGPCNFKCGYCTLNHGYETSAFDQFQVFEKILEQLEAQKLIDGATTLRMACGEFSATASGRQWVGTVAQKHPLILHTNAYLYSEQAARALEYAGIIHCSVDAGTAETFAQIKGVRGFEQVSETVRAYAQHGPVMLKYILLSGVNDRAEDLDGFARLADDAAVKVTISRDFRNLEEFPDRTLRFAAEFIKHFQETGKFVNDSGNYFRRTERERFCGIMEALQK